MDISFVPSICRYRRAVLKRNKFLKKKKSTVVDFFPRQLFFSPRFSIFISERILVPTTNSGSVKTVRTGGSGTGACGTNQDEHA